MRGPALACAALVMVATAAAHGAAPVGAPAASTGLDAVARELPQVLYVVPWKDPEPRDPSSAPRVRLDEDILRPLDRDEFRRSLGLADEAAAAP